MRVMKVCFAMQMRWLSKAHGMGLTSRRTNLVVRRLELSVHPPFSREKRVAGDWISSQWPVIESVKTMHAASIKTQEYGAQRASRLVEMWSFWERGAPGEGMDTNCSIRWGKAYPTSPITTSYNILAESWLRMTKVLAQRADGETTTEVGALLDSLCFP